MKNRKLCAAVLAAVIGLGSGAWTSDTAAMSRAEIAQSSVDRKGSNFKYWNKDAASYQALVGYVKDVTDRKSKNFIPMEDRIAVFDMDGTFLCETAPSACGWMLLTQRALHDKGYRASAAERQFAISLEKFIKSKDKKDAPGSTTPHLAAVFAGMGEQEYASYVRNFLETPVEGLSNLKWSEAFYLPMVEAIRYLQSNQFQVYVVSGSERQMARVLAAEPLHIPVSHIIGTDMEIKAAHQGDIKGADYDYRHDDSLVRGTSAVRNLKMNKVAAIAREIGKQPVIAFGNSSGDTSMLNYTVSGNKYKSAAFFLLCDDMERELGDAAKAAKGRNLAEKNGWTVTSMKDDFKTIYGENVKRVSAAQMEQGQDIDYLVLVNKTHKLPDDYEAKVPLITVKNSLGREFQIERETYAHFAQLREALLKQGIQIELDSIYRSVARQQEIVKEFTEKYGADYVKQYVAVPGYSEHHTGLAVDICLVVDDKVIDDNDEMIAQKEIFAKIHPLLADYGFILRYPPGKEGITGYSYEPWHFRYVGEAAAREISRRGVTFEEYMGAAVP